MQNRICQILIITILRHIYGIEKDDTKNLFAGQQWRNKHREQTYGHEEMYGESNMETYITIHKIDSQQEFTVWLRELKQGLCINLEGWDGEGDGTEV